MNHTKTHQTTSVWIKGTPVTVHQIKIMDIEYTLYVYLHKPAWIHIYRRIIWFMNGVNDMSSSRIEPYEANYTTMLATIRLKRTNERK